MSSDEDMSDKVEEEDADDKESVDSHNHRSRKGKTVHLSVDDPHHPSSDPPLFQYPLQAQNPEPFYWLTPPLDQNNTWPQPQQTAVMDIETSSTQHSNPRGAAARFSDQETICFLDLLEEYLPIGEAEWLKVTRLHNEKSKTSRKYDALRKKFVGMKKSSLASDDPNILPFVARAKQIEALILQRSKQQRDGAISTFPDEETNFLLDLVEMHLPITENEWKVVTQLHNEKFVEAGRVADVLKKKFISLKNTILPHAVDPNNLPTPGTNGEGEDHPNIPPFVLRAKKLYAQIFQRSGADDFSAPGRAIVAAAATERPERELQAIPRTRNRQSSSTAASGGNGGSTVDGELKVYFQMMMESERQAREAELLRHQQQMELIGAAVTAITTLAASFGNKKPKKRKRSKRSRKKSKYDSGKSSSDSSGSESE